MIALRRRRATPDEPPRCSGAMTFSHTGEGEAEYRFGLQRRVLCTPCADAAARLGMIDRRETPRA